MSAESPPNAGPELASKSQRKREADKVKDLARKLVTMRDAEQAQLPLDADIRNELKAVGRIRSNIARKRQMQFIAKLLRRRDNGPILEALAEIENAARQLASRQHRVEAWRDHLLESGDKALSLLLSHRQDIDIPAVRNHLRNAHKENRLGKPPSAQRALFRYLRDLDQHLPLPGI